MRSCLSTYSHENHPSHFFINFSGDPVFFILFNFCFLQFKESLQNPNKTNRCLLQRIIYCTIFYVILYVASHKYHEPRTELFPWCILSDLLPVVTAKSKMQPFQYIEQYICIVLSPCLLGNDDKMGHLLFNCVVCYMHAGCGYFSVRAEE